MIKLFLNKLEYNQCMHVFLDHDGLSHDFKTAILADTIEKRSIQVRLFDTTVHTGQISIGFEADTSEK